jgi:hypothetical protein
MYCHTFWSRGCAVCPICVEPTQKEIFPVGSNFNQHWLLLFCRRQMSVEVPPAPPPTPSGFVPALLGAENADTDLKFTPQLKVAPEGVGNAGTRLRIPLLKAAGLVTVSFSACPPLGPYAGVIRKQMAPAVPAALDVHLPAVMSASV